MREIKFRAWEPNKKIMAYPNDNLAMSYEEGYSHVEHSFTPKTRLATPNDAEDGLERSILMQFTGFKDKNDKGVYEGDIFRVEEDSTDIDDEDKIYYLVITWIQEWGMFCTLLVDEYHGYLARGIETLDEPMFWTYTLEDTASRKFFLCGNIYENPELLKYGQ